MKGMRILTVDIDPQGNTTSGLGLDRRKLNNTVYQMVLDDADITKCMHDSVVKNLVVIPSDVALAGAEIELIGFERREFILKQEIVRVSHDFDYIIIDCPPSLNILTVNAIVAADSVLVPIQCEYYALEGLSQLIHTISLVKDRLNPDLEIEGVVFTMFDARTNLSLQVVENVRKSLKQNIYNSIIPRNVKLAEAPSHGLPICMYDPRSVGAQAYDDLADEVLANDGRVPKDSAQEKKPEKPFSLRNLLRRKE